MTPALRAVRALALAAADRYPPGSAGARTASEQVTRLDAPLRLAIAGMVKAGKSTLVNALIGEEIAPTDAGECTRVVTWYRHAATPRVRLRVDGHERELPVQRRAGHLELGLDGVAPADVEQLAVDWPSPSLKALTLIDTPGISSVSAETSARTASFVTPSDAPSSADAVVYLMRHLHAGDVRFLESFRDTAAGQSAPAATIAVLSRADEVGAGRIDALLSATAVAGRYRREPVLRALCQTVVPVAGLLASSASTLRHEEYAALRSLASADRDQVARQLVSVDRFVAGDPADHQAGPSTAARAALLERFGVFGIRLAVTLVRAGLDDPTLLARDLVRRSGVDDLRELLAVRFAGRAGALKARSALLALERLLHDDPPASGHGELVRELERVRASAHELRELAALAGLRDGASGLAEEEIEEAEGLLGARGGGVTVRLGVPLETSLADLRDVARGAVARWRALAASPLQPRATAQLCGVVVRSAEGVMAELSRAGDR